MPKKSKEEANNTKKDYVFTFDVIGVIMSKQTIEYVSGACGGLSGLIVGHPLDTMKVLAQNSDKSSWSVLKEVTKAGAPAMFRGVSVPVWSYGVVNSVMFGSYSYAEDKISQLSGYDKSKTTHQVSKVAAAGAIAGCVQLIPACPVEVVKIRMQNEALHGNGGASVTRHLKSIIQESGVRGFYKGLTMHGLRDCTASAVYFVTYYKATEYLQKKQGWENLKASFVSGGLAGALSWICTMPQDVVKTRVQSGVDSGVGQALSRILKEGPLTLFKGSGFAIMRAIAVNSITFLGYEMVKDYLQKRRQYRPILIQAKVRVTDEKTRKTDESK